MVFLAVVEEVEEEDQPAPQVTKKLGFSLCSPKRVLDRAGQPSMPYTDRSQQKAVSALVGKASGKAQAAPAGSQAAIAEDGAEANAASVAVTAKRRRRGFRWEHEAGRTQKWVLALSV